MDHSHMDHNNMDHGNMGHGGMDHGNMCNMNMLFTWDTNNLCIVFKSWRVTSTFSLLWTLLAIIALTAGYELVREISRKYESKVQREIDGLPTKSKTIKAALYAVQVFYSFFIM
ncbi:unnamed protein product [Aureobasidium vineae]|uniref:Copper transport protein n=1 Tax=Aureobasidium vineae TaxID=2773715 RepID=A0A9N8JX88_9PEZI|nr:unnamed protein product [Aureobasidium vineae]